MKKNTKKVATLLLVAVVAVGSYFVAGTYARYASEVTGTSQATVAKWEWEADGTSIDLSNTKTFTFNLFNSIKEADTTSTEEHVSASRIAPGTGGTVTVALANKSEVDATYAVEFEVEPAGVPLQFCVGTCAADSTDWKDAANIAQLNVSATDINKENGTADINLKWRWAFGNSSDVTDATNVADTALGIAAQTTPAQPTVTAKVTLLQKD